jgi:hypothetical protein
MRPFSATPFTHTIIRASFRNRNYLGRVVFTQDIGFRALAEDWQHHGRPLAGLIFGHQMRGTIGQFVQDLELIARASDPMSG